MIVAPGMPICDGRGQLRGHGTYADEKTSTLVSSTLGSVERVASWVAVKPAKHRYMPEVGDIVVGRIRDIAAKRWLVDIGARQDASLPLSAIHLSGGDQRRRTVEDQLAMRQILSEGDLISAEVHSVLSDGGIQLHARSMQYGKLENGTLVRVGAFLVPRQKQHVLSLPAPLGCDMVLGVNGWIFLTGSLGLGGDAASEAQARSDTLAIEDELAEAIESRKRLAASTAATSSQRRGVASLRSAALSFAEEGRALHTDDLIEAATEVFLSEKSPASAAAAGGAGEAASR